MALTSRAHMYGCCVCVCLVGIYVWPTRADALQGAAREVNVNFIVSGRLEN